MKSLLFKIKFKIAEQLSNFSMETNSEVLHRSFMFHSVSDADDIYSVSLKKFESYLRRLDEERLMIGHFSDPSAKLSFTFDDGYIDNYTTVAPIMFKYNYPFTIFMISDFIEDSYKSYLSSEHLKELAKNKLITIGAHGKTHQPLTSISLKDAVEEMRVSKLKLEDLLGQKVTTMSFPHGAFNQVLLDSAKNLGYERCGTSVAQPNQINSSLVQVNRQCIFSYDNEKTFIQKFKGKWDWMGKSKA